MYVNRTCSPTPAWASLMISFKAGDMTSDPVRAGWEGGRFVGEGVVTTTVLLAVAGWAAFLFASAFSVSQAMSKLAVARETTAFLALAREAFIPV